MTGIVLAQSVPSNDDVQIEQSTPTQSETTPAETAAPEDANGDAVSATTPASDLPTNKQTSNGTLPTVNVTTSGQPNATGENTLNPYDTNDIPGAGAQSVTARKRIDHVKDVPFGVSVKTGKELENKGANRVQEAVRDVPNVNIQGFGDGRSTSFFVRGIGALRDPLSPDDTSFVVYVDGVPQPLFATDVGFLDLAQVELLKGPQGTLFGRNTTAGALNVTTAKPTHTPEFSIRAEVGEDGHLLSEAIASGPIFTDVLAGRVALRFSDIDGFVPNVLTGNDVGETKVLSGRGTLLYTPSDSTKLTLSFFSDRDDRTFPFFVLSNTPVFPTSASVKDNTSSREIYSATAILETKAKAFQFKSTTNATDLRTDDIFVDDTEGFTFSHLTGLPVSFFSLNNAFTDWKEKRRTFSQEVLLSSLPHEKLAWVFGASYFGSHFEADYFNENDPFPILSGKRNNELKSNSFSVFGESTVPIGERFKVTTGARLSHDTKSYDLKYTGVGTPGTVASFRDAGDLDFTFVTGRASLSYDLTPESTAFMTVSRGYKSGGYPRLAIDAAIGARTKPYQSSQTWTYEAGYKFHAKDQSAFFEFSAFYNDVKDEHVLAFDPLVFSFRPNNIDVRTYGVELSAGLKVSEVLTVSGALGYTEAELINIDPNNPVAGAKNGNHPTNVPKFTASTALQYRQPVSELGLRELPGNVFSHVSWEYIGERAADVANSFFLRPYHLVSARVGYEPSPSMQIYAFGKNLLDEIPELAGAFVPPNTQVAVPGRGRVIGLGTLVKW